MIALSESLLSILLVTATLATPSRMQSASNCSVPASAFSSLPQSFTPINSPPRFTAIGIMLQNYECTSEGNVL